MAEAVAMKLLGPVNRHGNLAPLYGGAIANSLPDEHKPGVYEYALELRGRLDKARTGDMREASDMLLAQALTLDGIFTEMARRAAGNMGQYLDATERYMRMALKAQAQSRATLQALADLHRPREQIVKHVTVNEGGQAVVADQFHSHNRGGSSERPADQPHAQGAHGTALPGPDAARDAMPVPSDPRETKVSAPRRSVDGGSNG
jgi:hypothetical protein